MSIKRGRPLKFDSPQKFLEAIETYFDAITREKVVEEEIFDHWDKQGKPQYRTEKVLNVLGGEIIKLEYMIPPTLTGIALHLHCNMTTLYRTRDRSPEFAEIYDYAKSRCEHYLEGELLTRVNVNGIKYDLSNNYGWSEKTEIGIDKKTLDYMSTPLDQRIKLLEDMGIDLNDISDIPTLPEGTN